MNYNIQRLGEINPELYKKLKLYCYDINGCCQIVHNELGPFLNEYMYQDALAILCLKRKTYNMRRNISSL